MYMYKSRGRLLFAGTVHGRQRAPDMQSGILPAGHVYPIESVESARNKKQNTSDCAASGGRQSFF